MLQTDINSTGGLNYIPTSNSAYIGNPISTDYIYTANSDNKEKIAFVEKLIRTRKISLEEGLLLLQEKVTVKTHVVNNAPYIGGTDPYRFNVNGPVSTFTSGSAPRSYMVGEFDTELPQLNRNHE